MSHAVIIHEVDPKSINRGGWQNEGNLADWLTGNEAVEATVLRQFGTATSQDIASIQVWSLAGTANENGEFINVLLVKPKLFALYCVHLSESEASQRELDSARRPGIQATKDLATSLQIRFMSERNVYSTMVSLENPTSAPKAAESGWLTRRKTSKSEHAEASENLMLAIGVAVERSLLNQVGAELINRKRPLMWHKHLRLLRRWPTLPAIDNTSLAEDYRALRNSLNLETRKADLLKVLELKERNTGLLLSSAAVLLAIVGLFNNNLFS